jgi:hypothetical protein
MRAIRFPIAGLMGAVMVVALGLAALRNGTETWAGVTFLTTCAVLCLAIVGIVCRDGAKRAWWLGFALFGWGYLLLAFWSPVELPTMALLDAIGTRLGAQVKFSGGMGGMGGGMRSIGGGLMSAGLWAGGFGGGLGAPPSRAHQQIAHSLWALVAALLGGILARAIFGGQREPADKLATPTGPPNRTDRKLWLRPAILGIAGCVLIVFLGLIGSRWAPGFWVGAAFLATCGLLGMTIVGAASARVNRQPLWLGAALFGVGYLILAFGLLPNGTWPSLPTDYLLQAVRRWFPPVFGGPPESSDGIISANALIWQALEQPVPMPFPEDTPLEDILKHIVAATRGPDGKGIPIYVDPIGLQEAEKSMTSTARGLEFEGVPLKTSLRLCLKQLDLSYCIRDGLLFITSSESESAVTPVYQDPFLIFGHCALALLAAGFGGIVAPLFYRRVQDGPTSEAPP